MTTADDAATPSTIRLEREYDAPPERIWELWTTASGIERWWSPDGFSTDVRVLDLRPGGALVHAMTASEPGTVAFMQANGMPLTNVARKTFTEVDAPRRLGYTSLVDFVPGVEPYEHGTLVEIEPLGDARTRVVMTIEPLHDQEWTGRILSGRGNELDNLAKVVDADGAR